MENRDVELIERARSGDRDAQRALRDRLLPVIKRAVVRRLYPLARARGWDPHCHRDDFVSGIWIRLFDRDWQALKKFDPTRGALEDYVTTISGRHVLAAFRTKSRDPFGEIPMDDEGLEMRSPEEQDLEQRGAAREELDDLYAFLQQRLDDRGLLLFHMLEVDGLDVAEVSATAEMSRDALYQWRRRFRLLVRQWRRSRG